MDVEALTLARDGKPPKEPKIGAFKLDGLGALRLTPRKFEPSGLFVRDDPKYDGVALLAIEARSEEHTSELQSLMRISYAVFCLKKKKDPGAPWPTGKQAH